MTSQTVASPPTGGDRVVALLKAHVPLSLLIDLVDKDPHSREIYEKERVTPS